MTDLQTVEDLEQAIRDSGGVDVQTDAAGTWGHVDRAESAEFDLPDRPPRDAVRVPTAALAGTPTVGDSIEVDGESAQVLDHREVEDGAVVAIVFGSWTHTVDVYRPSASGSATRGQQQKQYGNPIAQDVSCDVWAVDGEIRLVVYGREAVGEWRGAFLPGTDLEPGDLLRVKTGTGPQRYEVVFVGDETSHWRTLVDLTESQEDFG